MCSDHSGWTAAFMLALDLQPDEERLDKEEAELEPEEKTHGGSWTDSGSDIHSSSESDMA